LVLSLIKMSTNTASYLQLSALAAELPFGVLGTFFEVQNSNFSAPWARAKQIQPF
jgi:hypothetical protein